MSDKLTREECLVLLKSKADEQNRLPKKSDFTENEVARIKAYFGPWPRALEAAGLTPSKTEERITQNREKRTRAKQRRLEALKELKR